MSSRPFLLLDFVLALSFLLVEIVNNPFIIISHLDCFENIQGVRIAVYGLELVQSRHLPRYQRSNHIGDVRVFS